MSRRRSSGAHDGAGGMRSARLLSASNVPYPEPGTGGDDDSLAPPPTAVSSEETWLKPTGPVNARDPTLPLSRAERRQQVLEARAERLRLARSCYCYGLPGASVASTTQLAAAIQQQLHGAEEVIVDRDGFEAGMTALFRRVDLKDKIRIMSFTQCVIKYPVGGEKDLLSLPPEERARQKLEASEQLVELWLKSLGIPERRDALDRWFKHCSAQGRTDAATSLSLWPKKHVVQDDGMVHHHIPHVSSITEFEDLFPAMADVLFRTPAEAQSAAGHHIEVYGASVRVKPATGNFFFWARANEAPVPHNPLDLAEQHMLAKALAFVWLYRDEMLSEHVPSITNKEWVQAWRHVLAKHLNAHQEQEWVTAFSQVFPATFSSGGVPKGGGDSLVNEAPAQLPDLRWAGVRNEDREPTGYSRYHKLLGRECEKMLVEVFDMLDFSGDGVIDRHELAQFFKLLDTTDSCADIEVDEVVAEDCVDEQEKAKRMSWWKKEQHKLFARTDQMKYVLKFEQQRVCSLNMTDLQLEALVFALCQMNPGHRKEGISVLGLSNKADLAITLWEAMETDDLLLPTLVSSFILRGEFDKVEWGVREKLLEPFQIPDRELIDCAKYIVREDDYERLEAKFEETATDCQWAPDKKDKAHRLIFGTMISEDDFKKSYKVATGINLDDQRFSYIWDNMAAKFGGMVPKQTFFHFCGTEPMELMPTGVGGSYYLEYASYMRHRISVEQHLYLYVAFLITFFCVAVIDKGLGPGYYNVKTIEDFIGQELNPAGGIWYAQTFYDIANAEEWYQNFMPNVLDFLYGDGDGARGVTHAVENTNKIVGGLKIQQWRVEPESAHGLQELFDNNRPGACYTKADIGIVTDREYSTRVWTAPTVQEMDQRAATKPHSDVACVARQSSFDTATSTCTPSTAGEPYSSSVPVQLLSDRAASSGAHEPLVDCATTAGVCYYKWIPRQYTPYLSAAYGAGTTVFSNINATPPRCNPEGIDGFQPPTRFNRSIRVAVMDWDSGRLETEVLKWLVEEYLGVRVEVIASNAGRALSALAQNDGSVDVVLEIWEDNQRNRIESAIAGGALHAGQLGVEATMDLYVNKRGLEICPDCTNWGVLNQPEVAKLFSCASWTGATKCDEKCTLCGTPCNCSASDTIAAAAAQGGAAGTYDGGGRSWDVSGASCNNTGPCASHVGQLWDIAPNQGITTYGPELHRSRILRMSDHWNMQFASTEADLKQAVVDSYGFYGASPRPMAFFFYTPDELTGRVEAKRVTGFHTYSEEDCPRPNGINGGVSGGWRTNFSCALPKQQLLKMVSGALRDTHPDVFKVVTSMRFTQEDLDWMFLKLREEQKTHDVIACDWLTRNKEKWLPWLRYRADQNTELRETQYYQSLFPHWHPSKGNDKASYNAHAAELTPGSVSGRSAQKKLTDVLGVESLVPLRAEWDQMERRARENVSVIDAKNWHYYRPWMHQSCSELGAASFERTSAIPGHITSETGVSKLAYSCSGYGTILPISWTRTKAAELISDLERNNWIDVATRAVMVEFFVHNQMTRLFIRSRYLCEISAAGGWRVSSSHTVFQLWQWEAVSVAGWSLLMALNLGFITYFTWMAMRRLRRTWSDEAESRRSLDAASGHNAWCPVWPPVCINKVVSMSLHLLKEPGVALDLLGFGLMYITWAMRFTQMTIGLSDNNVLCTEEYPEDYTFVADLSVMADLFTGVNSIAIFLRTLIFLDVYTTMHRLLQTVNRAINEITGIIVALVILMLGFALCAWVVYGHYIEAYNGWGASFQTLLFVMLGEFDFEELDAIRPGYSFFFFFVFFVTMIAILFNVIIAVIGGAYDAVSEQLFSGEQTKAFIQQVMHDPGTCAWAPTRALGLGAWWSDGCVTREVAYWWVLLVRRPWLHCRMKCVRSEAALGKLQGEAERIKLAVMKNPRIFWMQYHKVLEGIASNDFTVAINAYATVKQLRVSTHVRQDMAVCECKAGVPVEVGDVVYCRDDDGRHPAQWLKGLVVLVRGTEAHVRVRCSRVQAAGPRAAPADYWQFRYDFDEIVHDFDSMEVGDELVLTVDVPIENGEDGQVAKAGTRVILRSKPHPAIVGTHPWRCSWLDEAGQPAASAEVVSNPVLSPGIRERHKMSMVVDMTEASPPPALTAQHYVKVDRCAVRPIGWEPKEAVSHRGGGMLVKMKDVSEFLDEQLGRKRRPALEFFLVQLPAKVLGMNQVRAYLDVLEHHYQWKFSVKDFADINEPSTDHTERHIESIGENVQQVMADVSLVKDTVTQSMEERLERLERDTTELKAILTPMKEVLDQVLLAVGASARRGPPAPGGGST
eukprot:TRINITY_DN3525_c0_g1_i1.p1 TRINITY_DN3525_c0_g1~~TRINITY_DN3525_c0_g1_i1.p1  ORF type:complete len:2345 (+),score=598.11 TRINITY_DN3525_c0_g1_i1:93-7037(+)